MLLVFGAVGTSNATWYEFNFDVLGTGATDEEIEVYMENTVPPPGNVVVNSGTTTTNEVDYLMGTKLLGPDTYLINDTTATMEIEFIDRNITEIIFDWEGMGSNTDDCILAYADNEETPFFSNQYTYNTYWLLHDLGTNVSIVFETPVQTLKFKNASGLGFVSLDNLWIENDDDGATPTPVPEPATMLLFGSGLIGLAVVGRKKIKRKLTVHG